MAASSWLLVCEDMHCTLEEEIVQEEDIIMKKRGESIDDLFEQTGRRRGQHSRQGMKRVIASERGDRKQPKEEE